jgi:hypothetical protein
MMAKSWQRPFDDPIPLPRGRELLTLKDAANYIMKLPKAEQNIAEWQVATEALIMAAEGRWPVMHRLLEFGWMISRLSLVCGYREL